MLKSIIAVLASLLIPTLGYAAVSLSQLLDMARNHAPQLQSIQADKSEGHFQAQSYLAQALPRLDLSLQQVELDAAASPLMSPGQSIDRFKYGNFSWELNLSSPLYTFGRVGSLYDMYRLQDELVVVQTDLSTDLALMKILESYTDVIRLKTLARVSEKAADYSQKLLSFAQVEYDAGSMNQIEYLRLKARSGTNQARFEQQQAAFEAAMINLKVALGLRLDEPFDIDDKTNLAESFFRLQNPEQRPSLYLKVDELSQKFAAANNNYRASEYFPTLSVFARASGQSYEFDQAGFPKQSPSDAFDKDRREYAYGIRLDWNLFAGTGTYAEHKIAQAQAAKASIELELQRRRESSDQKQALINAKAARKSFIAIQNATEASRLAYDQGQSEYRKGAISLSDLLEIEEELYRTEQQAMEAYGQLILAIADYRIKQGWRI